MSGKTGGARLEVPVRCLETWVREDVASTLRETLGFLSDDLWHFDFRQRQTGGPTQGIFDYGRGTGFSPGRVVMFSGGLDSFAGAVDEAIDREETVALVSHNSATKLAKVQRDLVAEIRNCIDPGRLMHVAVTAQLGGVPERKELNAADRFCLPRLGYWSPRCSVSRA